MADVRVLRGHPLLEPVAVVLTVTVRFTIPGETRGVQEHLLPGMRQAVRARSGNRLSVFSSRSRVSSGMSVNSSPTP